MFDSWVPTRKRNESQDDRAVSLAVRLVITLVGVYITAISSISPASGYEYSIYDGVPAHVWLLAGALVVTGIILLGFAAVYRQRTLAAIGFGAVSAAYAGYFLLPTIRGWEFSNRFGADEFVHIGIISDIVSTGVVEDIIYPGTHVLSSGVVLVSAAATSDIAWLINLSFFVLFAIGIGYACHVFSADQRLAICGLLVALPLYYDVYRLTLMPWLFGFSILVFALPVMHRYRLTGRIQWLVVFVVLMLGLMFIHPFTMLFGFLAIGTMLIADGLDSLQSIYDPRTLIPAGIVAVSFTGWHYHYETFKGHPRRMLLSLLQVESSSGGGVQTAQRAEEVNYTISQLVGYFFVPNWGVITVLFVSAGVVLSWGLLRYLRHGTATWYETFAGVQYVLAGGTAVLMLVVQLYGTNIFRMTQYLIFASLFVAAIGLAGVITRLEQRQRRLLAVTVVVLLVGPLVLYDASTAYGSHNQLGTATVEGYEWRFEHADLGKPLVADTGRDVYAYTYFGHAGVHTHDKSEPQAIVVEGDEIHSGAYPFSHIDPPHQLGYSEADTVSAGLDQPEDSYLLTRTGDREWWAEEPSWRLDDLVFHSDDDIDALTADRTGNRVFANGDVDLWTISADTNQHTVGDHRSLTLVGTL